MAEWKEYTVADVISTLLIKERPKKLGGDGGFRIIFFKNIKTGKIVQPDVKLFNYVLL